MSTPVAPHPQWTLPGQKIARRLVIGDARDLYQEPSGDSRNAPWVLAPLPGFDGAPAPAPTLTEQSSGWALETSGGARGTLVPREGQLFLSGGFLLNGLPSHSGRAVQPGDVISTAALELKHLHGWKVVAPGANGAPAGRCGLLAAAWQLGLLTIAWNGAEAVSLTIRAGAFGPRCNSLRRLRHLAALPGFSSLERVDVSVTTDGEAMPELEAFVAAHTLEASKCARSSRVSTATICHVASRERVEVGLDLPLELQAEDSWLLGRIERRDGQRRFLELSSAWDEISSARLNDAPAEFSAPGRAWLSLREGDRLQLTRWDGRVSDVRAVRHDAGHHLVVYPPLHVRNSRPVHLPLRARGDAGFQADLSADDAPVLLKSAAGAAFVLPWPGDPVAEPVSAPAKPELDVLGSLAHFVRRGVVRIQLKNRELERVRIRLASEAPIVDLLARVLESTFCTARTELEVDLSPAMLDEALTLLRASASKRGQARLNLEAARVSTEPRVSFSGPSRLQVRVNGRSLKFDRAFRWSDAKLSRGQDGELFSVVQDQVWLRPGASEVRLNAVLLQAGEAWLLHAGDVLELGASSGAITAVVEAAETN